MSRIGRKPVEVPSGVEISIAPGLLTASGPLGTEAVSHPDTIEVRQEEATLTFHRPNDAGQQRAFHGLVRSLVANAVEGVANGFTKRIEIRGVGYRAALEGKDLNLQLGYSHPIKVSPPEGITFEVEQGGSGAGNPPVQNVVVVKGTSKELVGQVAADIRKYRPVEPYKGKGMRYEGEAVRRKAGKAAK